MISRRNERPELRADGVARGRDLGERWGYLEGHPDGPDLLFTENETNFEPLFGIPNRGPFVKDAFHDAVVPGRTDRVNRGLRGTKAVAHYRAAVPLGGTLVVRTRLADRTHEAPFAAFDATIERRVAEADAFYEAIAGGGLSADEHHVRRRALAELLWTKQFYHFNTCLWPGGDPAGLPPPSHRAAAGVIPPNRFRTPVAVRLASTTATSRRTR